MVVPLAPTKVAPPAVKVVLKPSAAVISIPATPKLVPKPPTSLMLIPSLSKLVAPSIVVTSFSGSRSMPLIVLPTSLPSSSKLLAVIAPPSITVWLSAAPTVILPSFTTVSPMVIPSLSNLAMPSIVVTPSPLGTLPSTGSRSIPSTFPGRSASCNFPVYASRSLIALPTSLLSKVPNSKLPLTTVSPVAASTVKLP